MQIDHRDARTGGGYRYLHHDGPGSELQAWFHGVFHLVKRDGRTHLVTRSVFSSEQMRDGAVASGTEHGIRDSMDRLAQVLAG